MVSFRKQFGGAPKLNIVAIRSQKFYSQEYTQDN